MNSISETLKPSGSQWKMLKQNKISRMLSFRFLISRSFNTRKTHSIYEISIVNFNSRMLFNPFFFSFASSKSKYIVYLNVFLFQSNTLSNTPPCTIPCFIRNSHNVIVTLIYKYVYN